ncbi:MAG: protein kinase [Kiritimatiellae bacterium]|nr:protein kinase [Kiritimatiellia bacterium]
MGKKVKQTTRQLKRHNVLVVDDDNVILTMVERLLSCVPHNLILTASPQEALEILKTTEIAVLLCDMAMPQLDGTVVLSEARKLRPDIVSILVSGKADRDSTIRAINEGGIWKFILKPWQPEELIRTVEEALQRYENLCWQKQKLEDLAKSMEATIKRKTEVTARKRGAAAHGRPEAYAKAHVVVQKRRITPRIVHRRKDSGASLGKRYRILELIDEGGMGTVYKAQDTLLGIPVAVKVLSPSYTSVNANVRALKEEARIAMQLSHRHIVRLHNLQITGGSYFLVMEFVEGCTFRQILHENDKLPLNIVLQVVDICADALDYAHRHDVLHRDLKPENIMLASDGVLKIIDFGLACLMSAEEGPELIAGTPIYMSPEQIRGELMDQRTDIYSLGAIAYELLSGYPPFPADATAEEILSLGPPDLPDIPDTVREVIQRALSANREDRWPSAGSLSRALSQASACLMTT